ncbi:uncharacterized protein LOC112692271 isoform X2 [Sipha flava]|uniref:Uncharacterized protein LOC112692271 isoform X2 n=1 Tax=Sipha flava TaxID=143950 RepID=A0A8B8GHG8_9HEMI|nr:uncharacterized protein LOC112692271 isoform X2 [Sipha flava]
MATLRAQNMKLKGTQKKNLKPRCFITDPYEKFWPLLDPDKTKVLVNEMEKSILKMGINEVSRCIEKNQLACCLIAEDVANSVIAKHLLLMTAAKKIPVLIISDLHSITKRIIGFSSVTIGLKTDILNKKESSLHNLYHTIVQFSSKFKNPYFKQITKRESISEENPIKLNVNIENYLLKKPREGRAFVPEGTSNVRTLDDLSFIPIDKIIVKERKPYEKDEELIEVTKTTNLFSIDTKPLPIEDIGESVERKTKTYREPLRYYGLKMKKMKPNPNRRQQKEENTNKINK